MYEDFIKDDELEILESNNNFNKTNQPKKSPEDQPNLNISKREQVMQRIKSLALTLEEENFDMFEIDYSSKTTGNNFSIADNLAKGVFKHETVQTPELESKSIETIKM